MVQLSDPEAGVSQAAVVIVRQTHATQVYGGGGNQHDACTDTHTENLKFLANIDWDW